MFINRTQRIPERFDSKKARANKAGEDTSFADTMEAVMETDAVELSRDALENSNQKPRQQQKKPASKEESVLDVTV